MKILLVSSDKEMLDVWRDTLRDRGEDVIFALSANEALEYLRYKDIGTVFCEPALIVNGHSSTPDLHNGPIVMKHAKNLGLKVYCISEDANDLFDKGICDGFYPKWEVLDVIPDEG